jgi:nitrous oxidase accessory protein NosD
MTYWVDDLAALYTLDTPGSVTVTFGAATAVGLLDTRDDVAFGPDGFQRVIKVRTLRLRASDFPTLVVGSTVTISSTSYTVRGLQTIEEGAEKEAILAAVTP